MSSEDSELATLERKWKKRLERSERARRHAEDLLESKSRSLYDAHVKLKEFAVDLEQRVHERTAELRQARDQALLARREASVATDAAKSASLAKSEFLAKMSHEIRTPLAAVMGYAELLSSLHLPSPEERSWVRYLRVNAEYLSTLVGEVLDLSKIESGHLEVVEEDVDLAHEFDKLEEMIAPRAKEKGLDWSLVARGSLPVRIRTDPGRIRQILLNVAFNAIKFTDRGRIDVCVQVVEDPSPKLQISIADTGVGIAESDLEQIFMPFRQLGTSSDNTRSGTGLGLDISRKLARKLGGELEVQAVVGAGSVFTLILPLSERDLERREVFRKRMRHESGPRIAAMESDALGDVTVAIADDTPDNRRILTLMLERAGARVTSFTSGIELLEHLQQAAARRTTPSIVLLDLQMPEMSGYATSEILRDRGYAMPVLALSADATQRARQRASAAGCSDYLSKPVRPEVLVEKIRSLLRRPAPPPVLRGRAKDHDVPPWLLARYVNTLRRERQAIADAFGQQDFRQLKLILHRLAGSGASYGFPELTTAARECERALDSAPSPDALKKGVDSVTAHIGEALGQHPEGGSHQSCQLH